ncbi:MAG: universal stress protein [Ardenticatenaceae bacterium]|nr:universal stress protein [Ardenticatenaceae bacterium]
MRILVATGGANHSDTAVLHGAHIAQYTHSSLTLLTVIRHEDDKQQAAAILTRAASLAAQQAITAEKRVRVGQVAAEIIKEANSGNYDLLVVGERQTHGFMTRFFGPTADRIIAHMPCPIIIAHQGHAAPKRLLLCEGGRDPSLLARVIGRLTPLLTASQELTVLHVMSQMAAAPGITGWELQADAGTLMAQHTREGELLERDAQTLQMLPVHLQTKIRHGLVVEEILAEASGGDYDLVIIGAHQGSKWERFLLDDLAHRIVTKSNTSILIVS